MQPMPPGCTQCGAPLEPGQAACASCGKLVAPAPQSVNTGLTIVLAIVLGLFVGLFAGGILSGAVMSGVAGLSSSAMGGLTSSTPGTYHTPSPEQHRRAKVAAWSGAVAGTALEGGLCLLAFWFGLRSARRQQLFLGVFLMTTAAMALLPVTLCSVALFAIAANA